MRRLADRLLAACRTGLGPRELALTIALGTLCAFFPILGLATPLCVAAGLVFRLNHPLLQALNAITSPAYLPVAFALMKLGDHFLGPSGARVPAIAGHALFGWCLVAPLWTAVCYLSLLAAFRLRGGASPRQPFVPKAVPAR